MLPKITRLGVQMTVLSACFIVIKVKPEKSSSKWAGKAEHHHALCCITYKMAWKALFFLKQKMNKEIWVYNWPVDKIIKKTDVFTAPSLKGMDKLGWMGWDGCKEGEKSERKRLNKYQSPEKKWWFLVCSFKNFPIVKFKSVHFNHFR